VEEIALSFQCPQCSGEIEKDEGKCPHCNKVLIWKEGKPLTLEDVARKRSGCFFLSPGLYAPLLFIILLIILGLIFALQAD